MKKQYINAPTTLLNKLKRSFNGKELKKCFFEDCVVSISVNFVFVDNFYIPRTLFKYILMGCILYGVKDVIKRHHFEYSLISGWGPVQFKGSLGV